MKRNKKLTILVSALALAALCAGAALAAGGDEQDPLVTLSYLKETVIPQVVAQAEEKAAARQAELVKQFDEKLAHLQQNTPSSSEGGGASYTLVNLTKGQALKPDVGCELLLRVGSMTAAADSDPALIDASTGGVLNRNASLEKNHLYIATIEGRTVQATSDAVKVLVRGTYTVE